MVHNKYHSGYHSYKKSTVNIIEMNPSWYIPNITVYITAVMAQSVKAFTSQAEGWVFESKPRQTLVIKTGSNGSAAKYFAKGDSVMRPRR